MPNLEAIAGAESWIDLTGDNAVDRGRKALLRPNHVKSACSWSIGVRADGIGGPFDDDSGKFDGFGCVLVGKVGERVGTHFLDSVRCQHSDLRHATNSVLWQQRKQSFQRVRKREVDCRDG